MNAIHAELARLLPPIFERYGLSPEARKQAWESCFDYAYSPQRPVMSAVRCYRAIARSLRPVR